MAGDSGKLNRGWEAGKRRVFGRTFVVVVMASCLVGLFLLLLQSYWLQVADRVPAAGSSNMTTQVAVRGPAETEVAAAPADEGRFATQLEAPFMTQMQRQMLGLINEARTNAGLTVVVWDDFAAEVGARHAREMAEHGYFSHWNFEGWGPDHRYSLAGSHHAVMENLHAFSLTYEDGRGAPVQDWSLVIANGHQGLMESEGHRANILDPAHTHVGIGMAYNPQTGQFRLAQEFTNQYVQLYSPLPREAQVGQELSLQGQVNGPDIDNILLSLAYEAYPEPLWPVDLAQKGAYLSAAESVEVWRLESEFNMTVSIPAVGESGMFHLRIFGDVRGRQALLMDHVVVVRP